MGYTDAAITELRRQAHPVNDLDIARLVPLTDGHLNVLGRYTSPLPATTYHCGHYATQPPTTTNDPQTRYRTDPFCASDQP
jgi:hypothetical protein